MNQFSTFGIKPQSKLLEGDKIKIDRVLNKPITVHDYRIGPSNFPDKGNGKRLDLQITVDNSKRVIFSGSGILMDMIEQVPKDKFPFKTTIVKENDRLEFR